jgi:Holliday junction resolvase-like predicted endonuclease
VSKSIYVKKQHAGYSAEVAVAQLLRTHGWNLCFHSLKTQIAEIDLVLNKNKKVLLIEVKTLDSPWRSFQRIHSDQLLKLQKNLSVFSFKLQTYSCQAYVAWVDKANKVSFVSID